MKRTPRSRAHRGASDEMSAEYRFDYRKARPNRFAGQVEEGRLIVVLDPDVSEAFPTQRAVNTALRALIAAMPAGKRKTARH